MRMVEKSINPKTVDGRPSWLSVEDRRGERLHRARLLAPDGSTRALGHCTRSTNSPPTTALVQLSSIRQSLHV
jgi:hypothetical protein